MFFGKLIVLSKSFLVKVCNSTADVCQGSQSLCMGAEEDIFYRRKRALAVDPTEIPDTDETQKIISRGPIVAYMAENAGEGEFTVNSIFLDGDSTVRLIKLNQLNVLNMNFRTVCHIVENFGLVIFI